MEGCNNTIYIQCYHSMDFPMQIMEVADLH